jgi:hypothetical protein
MDKDEIVRFLDRKLKIRALHCFDRQEISIPEYEREFALAAIDLMCRQPIMADLIDGPEGGPIVESEVQSALLSSN